MYRSTEPPSPSPIRDRGRLPASDPTGQRATSEAPLSYDPHQGYNQNLLGIYPRRSLHPTGNHVRSKSCGFAESKQPTRPSQGIGSGSAESERPDVSIPSTPDPWTRPHTRSASHGTLEVSSRLGDDLHWNLYNIPGMHDLALEPYSKCIGKTQRSLRCKNSSKCRQLALDAIRGARGVLSIDQLEDIAGNLLCSQWHQNQALEIAESWERQFATAPAPPRPETRGRSIPSTPDLRTRTHARSKSHSTLEASPRSNEAPWNLDSMPGIYDAALEPYSRCIGQTREHRRCKLSSSCGQSPMKLARGVPTAGELESIARNLLCIRWHQGQAECIAESWGEQLTASPESPGPAGQRGDSSRGTPGSPGSTLSQGSNSLWGTPGPGSSSTTATSIVTGLLSPRDASEDDLTSPSAARRAKVIAKRSGQRTISGDSTLSEGSFSGSRYDNASSASNLDLDSGEAWTPGGSMKLFGSSIPSGGGPNEPLLGPQDEGDIFSGGFKSPIGPSERAIPPSPDDAPGLSRAQRETAGIDRITPPDLRELLGLMDCVCVCRNRTKLGNCSRKLRSEKWEKSKEILKTLAKHKLPGEAEAYFDGLQQLAKAALCWQHQKWARAEADYWRSVIEASIGKFDLRSRADSPPAVKSSAAPEITISAPEAGEAAQWEYVPRRRSSRLNTSIVRESTTSPEIGPFRKYTSDGRTQKVSIRQALTKALTYRERHTIGSIYVYDYPETPGHVKIGVTGKTVDERLRDWERTCARKPVRIYPPRGEENGKRTRHIYRVEALVMMELIDYRRKMRCRACGRDHEEWFEVSKEKAVDVVEKWRSWMAEKPRYIERAECLWVLSVPDSELRSLSHEGPNSAHLARPQNSISTARNYEIPRRLASRIPIM